MQWQKRQGRGGMIFKLRAAETGERSGRARSHREWPSSAGELSWAWSARSERIFLLRKEEADGRRSSQPGVAAQDRLLRARAASARLALLSTEEKKALLLAIADAIEANAPTILAANREDVERSGLEGAMREPPASEPSAKSRRWRRGCARLRRSAIRSGRPGRVDTPERAAHPQGARAAGVVGIIYESRPNVTVDTAVLALKPQRDCVARRQRSGRAANQRLVKFLRAVPGVRRSNSKLLDSSTRQSVQE